MPKYVCDKCGKYFSQKCHYIDHLNRKNPCKKFPPKTSDPPPYNSSKKENITASNNICSYYGIMFTRRDNLSRHINERCKVKQENDSKMEKLMTMLIEMKNTNKKLEEHTVEMKEEMTKMTLKVNKLEEENANYKNIITNNTQNIKIDNQTNNIINIVAYGQEDLKKISDAEYQRILRRGFNSVPAFMESLHFDKNKPENHNVYISNMRDDYILMYDGTKWRLKNREDTLQQLYEDKADILETKFEELLERLDENTIKMFKRFIKVRDTDEDAVKRIKKDLKIMLYENREMVSKNKCIKDIDTKQLNDI